MAGAVAAEHGMPHAPVGEAGFWALPRATAALGAGVIGGVAAGVVAGAGSRLAMRLSALLMAPPGRALTADGNRVGVFTIDGSLFLVLFVGTLGGLVGGATYAVARTWLAPLGRWRGLAFGALLLAAYGRVVFSVDNFDFFVFGSPIVNVPLYGSLFVLFGLVAAPVADWASQATPRLPAARPLGWRRGVSLLVALGAGAVALVPIIAFTGATIRGTFFHPSEMGFAIAVTVFVTVVWLVPIAALVRDSILRPAGYALAVAPIAVGGFFTVREIVAILTS